MSATMASMLSSIGGHDWDRMRVGKRKQGRRWRWGEGRRCTLVSFAVVSSTITMAALACVGFCPPLLSLALVCPSRNADSEGQFPSRFNDPCDSSARNVSSEAARPVSPGPHLFQNPEGGLSPLFHHHHCHRWQKARVETVRNRPLMCQTPPLVCHHCLLCYPGEQMKRRSREDGPISHGADKLSASCS